MKILCLSGPDCAGKNSVMHELAKIQNFSNFYCPRSPICNLVYDEIYGRNTSLREQEIIQLISKFMEINAWFFLLTASTDEIMKRVKNRGDNHIRTAADAFRQIMTYEHVFTDIRNLYPASLHYRFLRIDNTILLPQETAVKINQHITNNELK